MGSCHFVNSPVTKLFIVSIPSPFTWSKTINGSWACGAHIVENNILILFQINTRRIIDICYIGNHASSNG